MTDGERSLAAAVSLQAVNTAEGEEMMKRSLCLAGLLAGCGDDIKPFDTGALAAPFRLEPTVAAPGELLIGSVVSDAGVDLSRVAEVRFLDGAAACAAQARADELLVTIGVGEGTPAGSLDMVLLFEGGDTVLVEDVLTITSAGQIPGSDGYPCR